MNIFKTERSALIALVIGGVIIIFGLALWANMPPRDFPVDTIITVEKGNSARRVVQYLKDHEIIRSREFALFLGTVMGTTENLVAGEYQFSGRLSTIGVMKRIGVGIFGIVRERVTLLEGWTNAEFALALDRKLDTFDTKTFLTLTRDQQGFLFPDTYFFRRNVTTEEVVAELRANFDRHRKDFPDAIGRARNRELVDIITMASLLEREATNYEDARMISDILWSRLDAGMPLQVDATLKYATGRGSSELTQTDLRTDSPYNTYTRRGLPPTPIGNPGLAMIRAALLPMENTYVYYLHASDGTPHYASTFSEHVANKKRYLP